MNILYAIQGTGNGHISRAQAIIPVLKNHAKVDILISGNQNQLSLPFATNYQQKGLTFLPSKSGKVAVLKSIIQSHPIDLIREIRKLPVKQYDLVISDFEPVSAWSALLNTIPCIELSHQAGVIHPNAPKPEEKHRIGNYILHHYCPTGNKYGFHFESYGKNIFTPVIRQAVRQLNPRNNGYFTVYLPAYDNKHIASFLRLFDVKWEVFSKYTTQTEVQGNITFHPINDADFLKSMEKCEGVLCGAGFELPAEALYLEKKLMVIPMIGQFEQLCNAESLKQMGIPVLPNLDPLYYRKVKNWLNLSWNIRPVFPDVTDDIISQVLQDYEAKRIPSKRIDKPLLNPQFYRYFF
jgi:uncharacterized protein (TIGR00661 family)